MESFNIKSILLGIGIGIILASLLNMVYIAGARPGKELTDQEIMNKAEKLGMVPASDIIEGFYTQKTEHKKPQK